jgi:hypothetical protein
LYILKLSYTFNQIQAQSISYAQIISFHVMPIGSFLGGKNYLKTSQNIREKHPEGWPVAAADFNIEP